MGASFEHMTAREANCPTSQHDVTPAGGGKRSAADSRVVVLHDTDFVVPKALGDDELEAHIHDCGRLIERAMAHGDRQEAVEWQQAMYQAIAARSVARKAAMQAEIDQRIADEVAFFSSDAAQAMGRVTRA